MLKDLIEYTNAADKLYIEVFEKAGYQLIDAENLFSHILNAQHIWICRIYGNEPDFERFQTHHVKDFKQLHEKNIAQLKSILLEFGLEDQITYKQSDNQQFTNAIADILIHIVNHSTYHRAQVATILRKNNVSPPATDYIKLKREGLL